MNWRTTVLLPTMPLLNTSIYVNDDAEAVQTRAASNGMPEFAAKYVDNDNIIHPAVIHLTDPYGYDNDIHYEDDPMDATQTRAAASGHYQYMTAEELAGGKTRFSVHPNVLSLKSKFNFYHRLHQGGSFSNCQSRIHRARHLRDHLLLLCKERRIENVGQRKRHE